MKLLINGKLALKGDIISDSKGNKAVLTSWQAPHKINSSGKVYVKWEDGSVQSEYFPSVFNGEFVKED